MSTFASPRAAADLADVPLEAVFQGMRSGAVDSQRVGGKVVVRLEDVDRLRAMNPTGDEKWRPDET
jgi:hypothetical protein